MADLDSGQWLGEDVGRHVLRRKVLHFDLSLLNTVSHKQVPDVDVLCSLGNRVVLRDCLRPLVVTENGDGQFHVRTEHTKNADEPDSFSASLGKENKFTSHRRQTDSSVDGADPQDADVTELDDEASMGVALVLVTSPVCITVHT